MTFLSTLGPAGLTLIGFLASLGSLTMVYAAQVLRCRMKAGRECGFIE